MVCLLPVVRTQWLGLRSFFSIATIARTSSSNTSLEDVRLAYMLVMLLGVIFTIPAHGLSVPVLELLSLAALVVAGMIISTYSVPEGWQPLKWWRC
jgi:hypothetical protein